LQEQLSGWPSSAILSVSVAAATKRRARLVKKLQAAAALYEKLVHVCK